MIRKELVIFLFLFTTDVGSELICNGTSTIGCQIAVDSESANQMLSDMKETESILVKAQLKFQSDIMVGSTNGTILPTNWIMTQFRKGGSFFTSWPVDYFLYSFGLLDSRTLTDVILEMKSSKPSCSIIIGEENTNCAIMTALHNISKSKEYSSYWCYISEYPGIRHTTWYALKVYFGLPLGMFGYRCCHKEKDGIYCDDEYNVKWNEYQVLPYYVGIVFFCFFPILLMKCSARAMDSGSKFKDKTKQYEDLDQDKDEWLYLQNRSPITVSSLLMGIFSLGEKHPVTASRIRRVVFILGLPAAVYAEICMYHLGWPELVPALVKAKIPFGFASIVGGIRDSCTLFLPMIGGPFISLILFYVVGIIVLVLPRDLGAALQKGLTSDSHNPWTILQLNIITIEELSFKSCINKTGYHKVHAVLKASVFMIISPQFWHFIVKFFVKRWHRLVTAVHIPRNRCLRWPLYAILWLFYVTLSVIETELAVIYYGIPMFKFLNATVKGYTLYLNRQFLDRHKILKVFFRIMSPIFLLYHLFMCCVIILESFNFLSKVMFFLYLSVVIFPNYSFGFVYSFLMLIFFICRIGTEIEGDYFDLLHQTIKAVKHLNGTRTEHNEFTKSTIEIRKEMDLIGDISSHDKDRLREKCKLPGIRKELFQYVVRKHRPVHIAIFLGVMQICVMAFLVLASMIFVSRYVNPMKTDERNDIFHVMSILLITILPNLVHNFFTPKINHKVRKLKIRQTVVNFYQLGI